MSARVRVVSGIQVSSALTLEDLHRVVQIVMGWTNSHPHSFTIGDRTYGNLDTRDAGVDVVEESDVRFDRVLKGADQKFSYLYDFGDDWQHELTVKKIVGEQKGCVSNRSWGCPPEDCGGITGYRSKTPDNPEHNQLLAWAGGNFDPESFDPKTTNQRLDNNQEHRLLFQSQ